jgi:tripartite ATP-independent transporter DctP family solute receptor
MRFTMNRRAMLKGTTAFAAALAAAPAFAQDKVQLIYSDTVPEADIRSKTLLETFGGGLGDGFDFKPYHGATLFAQGTELVAMQRGNLDMAALAIYDLQNQIPALGILGAAYLFRDYDHMRRVFASDVAKELFQMVEDQLGVKVLANPYIGTRHLNLRGDKKVMTPADLAGVKLRMPGGEGWQFVGTALGANPTPMAFTEVYTGLQTGAIDGQDNPLPADKSMKFYEVTKQIILTAHLIAANQFTISKTKWDSLTAEQQAAVQTAAHAFEAALDQVILGQEAELVEFFKAEGLEVYEPDRAAFRAHVLEEYAKSPFSKDWPEGMLARIEAL